MDRNISHKALISICLILFSSTVTEGQTSQSNDLKVDTIKLFSDSSNIETKICRITDYTIEYFRNKYRYEKPKSMYYIESPLIYYLYDRSEFPIKKPYENDFFVFEYEKEPKRFEHLSFYLNKKYTDFKVSKTEGCGIKIRKIIFNSERNKVAIHFIMLNGAHSFFSTKQVLVENNDKTWKCETLLGITVE